MFNCTHLTLNSNMDQDKCMFGCILYALVPKQKDHVLKCHHNTIVKQLQLFAAYLLQSKHTSFENPRYHA